MERLIFHVDVNSAYLSWEAARRVKNGESDLREIPSCIGGDPKKRHGILIHSGTDIVTVSKRLGHANTSTTLNIYSHIIAESDEKVSESLADILLRAGSG